MRIGIVSDTHNRLPTVARALQLLEDRFVDLILHCGDIEDVDIVWRFPAYSHFVFGNCDSDRDNLRQAIADIGATLHEPFGKLTFPGGDIAFVHGDDRRLLLELEDCGKYAYVFHGHTHIRRDEQKGPTRVVNPGALQRAAVKTCAMLDLEKGKIESIVVE